MPSDITPATLVTSDDAELLRLGAELDEVEQDYLRQCAADELLEDDADDKWAAIDKRLYPLFDKIMAHTATTVAGLAIQTKAIGLAAEDLWSDVPDNRHKRQFIEAVCRFTGVVPVELKVKAPTDERIIISDTLK
ncbi:MAG TPA: hypothetical protein VGJ20_24910 [Xanthobacteraceae bacterium]|jgi:hypothetical protein